MAFLIVSFFQILAIAQNTFAYFYNLKEGEKETALNVIPSGDEYYVNGNFKNEVDDSIFYTNFLLNIDINGKINSIRKSKFLTNQGTNSIIKENNLIKTAVTDSRDREYNKKISVFTSTTAGDSLSLITFKPKDTINIVNKSMIRIEDKYYFLNSVKKSLTHLYNTGDFGYLQASQLLITDTIGNIITDYRYKKSGELYYPVGIQKTSTDDIYVLLILFNLEHIRSSLLLIKYDKFGKYIFDKIVLQVKNIDQFESPDFILNPDNTMVINYFSAINNASTPKSTIIKIDSLGNIIWKNIFFEPSDSIYYFKNEKNIFKLTTDINGNIFGVGYAESIDSHLSNKKSSPWLFCLDKDGEKKWEKTILNTSDSQIFTCKFNYITLDDQNNIVLCGQFSDSSGDIIANSFQDYSVIVKLDNQGCNTSNCDSIVYLNLELITALKETESPLLNDFKIYPNPSSDVLYIYDEKGGNSQYTITDIKGNTIRKWSGNLKDHTYIVQLHDFSPGVYIVSRVDHNGRVRSGKFVKR